MATGGKILSRLSHLKRPLLKRPFSTGQRLMSDVIQEARPGANLPFMHPGENRYVFTVFFTLFFSTGLTLPFVAIRNQICKK